MTQQTLDEANRALQQGRIDDAEKLLRGAVQADPQWAGKECKAGIITGAFSVPTHETMRKAILAGLKAP